jgi:hypothetical protein
VYGAVNVDVGRARSDDSSTVIALLVLVIGLAAATIAFVAVPLVDEPRSTTEACGMLVVTNAGSTCISEPPVSLIDSG